MKNNLTDLKNYLFEQIERVNDDDLTAEELDKEIKRSKAVTEASKTIVEIAKTQLDAFKYATEELGIETNSAAVGDLLLLGDAVKNGKSGGVTKDAETDISQRAETLDA